ncbi:DNA-3-methyladenine glycosylase 2 family protein [Leucobacter viscericola]|uniref:DNA-3-methyladenine glycosylase 2 family protein n=1 Tax=Leucobacter viscericola TaxID=2714935 RepID=UPI001980557E|nr:Ada metal-binding domain-containing protein [Leucobacter viscericola]
MNPTTAPATLDFDACYRAASGRDARWDGRVYLGVTSTGIYCRPSCPARKPRPENCRFYSTAAACVAAGFRACKRCRPDAVPGTRDWDARGDLVARAVRRIRDGAVDTVGVAGLATELAVSERHLRRMLIEEVGASPLQLARTRRAHAARALIEETQLPLTDVAFAAGFGSVRQFGDTMREEFGVAPSALSRRSSGSIRGGEQDPDGPTSDERPKLALRLRTRAPFAAAGVRAFLAAHAIPGRDEIATDGTTSHAIDVPGGTAVVRIEWPEVPEVSRQLEGGASTVGIPVTITLPGLADTMPAIQAVRRLLDLDADPGQIEAAFMGDPVLGDILLRRPGLRLPGARHPQEFALGTVLGQQVSLAAARTLQGRLAEGFESAVAGSGGAASGFRAAPDPVLVAAIPVEDLREQLGLTRARAATLSTLASALAGGLDLGPGADRDRARAELLALRGIGPWTVELVAMRALGDPDAYPAGDLILRRALGVTSDREAIALAQPWRPYRGYATQYLWSDFLEATARKEQS